MRAGRGTAAGAAAALAALLLAVAGAGGNATPSASGDSDLIVRRNSPLAERGERNKVIGESVRGRAIVARRWGDRHAERRVVVVGSIHGDETQGHRVVKELAGRRAARLERVELWTIETVNPDGVAADRRGNARGVDLNRNFPYQWKSIPPSSGYYSGPKPASEPETRDVMRFLRDKRPNLTIWYHQPWGETLVPCNRASRKVALRYAKLSGLPPSDGCNPSPPGAATGWQRHTLKTKAFVAEFPGGSLSSSQVRRHARAVAEIAEPG